MTETQERFLRALAARVPVDRVVEAHVFPPIRQGGMETGVAVLAASPATLNVGEPGLEVAATGTGSSAAEASAWSRSAPEPSPSAAGGSPPEGQDSADSGADRHRTGAAGGAVSPDELDPAPAAACDPTDTAAGPAPAADAPVVRHTVYTARYRLALKGAERGRWEVDVVEEADAPLVTVDAVVRGVQRRAGDAGEPERVPGDAFRALAATAPSLPPQPAPRPAAR